jgi:hypothetical protein
MSKKLYSTAKWKKYLRSRQVAELKNRRRSRRERRISQRPRGGSPSARKFVPLKAPAVFSILRNADEVNSFLREFALYSRQFNIDLDLRDVTDITPDAIAVLLANVRALDGRAYVKGNRPSDLRASEILAQSGFFSQVRTRTPAPPCKQGMISQRQRASKQVEPRVAQGLVHFGTEAISGVAQRNHSTYRVLIESMSNTQNHAAGKRSAKQSWWATVYADLERKRVCYTFLDTGVGIFRSVRIGAIRRAFRFLGVVSDADILVEIFKGGVQSRTGVPYRGKGLPSIYRLSELGRIQSLVIVSNEVYADVSAGHYRMLRSSFPGTLLYWEILASEMEKAI